MVGELEDLDAELVDELSASDPRMLRDHPVEEFFSCFESDGPRRYNYVPAQLEAWFPARTEDAQASRTYMKVALARRMRRFVSEGAREHYPPSVRSEYDVHLKLMLRAFGRSRSNYFRLRNDLFLKDLALLDGRMVPGGAQLIETCSGVPRSLLRHCGLIPAIEFSWFWMSRLRGFAPFFEMHTDPRRLQEFTREGWDQFYLRTVEMLELHPEILGVWGGAWWNDPAVPAISPHLAFLRDVPLAHGARTFRYTEDEEARANALTRSVARRKAYESGGYRPTNYFLLWGRKDIMRWARELRRSEDAGNEC